MIKTFEKTPLKLNFSHLFAGDLFEYAGDVYIKSDVDNISWRIDKNEVKKQAENDAKNNENMVANNPYNYDEMEDFRSCNEHSYLPEDDVDDITANS
jgi:hypothetical protein